MNACDRLIRWGIAFLIFFTPFAFGSVHPWAFIFMETVVLLLLIFWMGKLLLPPRHKQLLPPPLLPLILFLGLGCLQLLPIPPALLHLLSPSMHQLYSRSLAGWPEKTPYHELQSATAIIDRRPKDSQVATDTSQLRSASDALPSVLPAAPELWRPLSLAPNLTLTSLIKWSSYLSLLCLVSLYPFADGRDGHALFLRLILKTILVVACALALIGIAQQWTWNGKFLWFFVPYDWNNPGSLDMPRASGPFINPDHFANYLAVIFPVALAGTFFHTGQIAQRYQQPFRVFCGCTVVLLIAAILSSLSRGGWIGIALGTLLMLGVFPAIIPMSPTTKWFGEKRTVTRYVFAGVTALILVALMIIGPTARNRVDLRLAETVEQEDSLEGRVAAWQDTIHMVQDFSLFGVGLGAWQDIFPRYQRPPWSADFYSEAHNDYVEILAETGMVGCSLLAWAAWRVIKLLSHGLMRISTETRPFYTALLTGLMIMGVHEFLDFSLQIPANAVLGTVALGTALRMAMSERASESVETTGSQNQSRRAWQSLSRSSLIPLGTAVTAALLIVLALQQERMPYPDSLATPDSLAEARARILAHPARADSHIELYLLLRKVNASLETVQHELTTALWLAPNDPFARDRYAALLRNVGKEEEGLREITHSMTVAPSLAAHPFLDNARIRDLSESERQAIEAGFKQAVALNYIAPVPGLSSLYAALGRFSDEAELYEEVASKSRTAAIQLQSFLNASEAYFRAEQLDKAESVLRQVIILAPQDERGYQKLATRVLARQGKFAQAKIMIDEGMARGADAFTLTVALADAAQATQNLAEVKAALIRALDLRPSSFDTQLRLGLLYLQERSFDRAVLVLHKALDIKPDSAAVFYHLGQAEEGRYQLFAAEKAYARALELDPENTGFRQHYEAFQKATRGEQGARS